MRILIMTPEYKEFVASVGENIQKKIDYITDILIQSPVINTKFVKKLENTDFYEMRISVGNEYRVILFTVDHPNIVQSTQVILLNGFIKKSTKDYKGQVALAKNILKRFSAEPQNTETTQD